MEIEIRPFNNNDAEEVSNIIISNLLYVNVVDYGEEVVKKLSSFYFPKDIIKYAQNDEIYVALSSSKIVGTVSLNEERVRNVFVNIDYHRKGIGKALMSFIENAAQKNSKDRLFLYSHPSAEEFYKSTGYKSLEIIYDNIDDIKVKVILMEKYL